jgi:hypothetical protein
VNVDVVHVATCGARSLARLGSPTHRQQLADPRRRRGKNSVRSIKHVTDNFPNFRPALQTNERPAQFPGRAPSVSLSVQLRGFIWPPRLRARSSRLVRRPSRLHSRGLGRVQDRLRCWLLYARWQARIIRLGDVDHGGQVYRHWLSFSCNYAVLLWPCSEYIARQALVPSAAFKSLPSLSTSLAACTRGQ